MKSIEFAELLRYNAGEARKWRNWLKKQPASVLDLPIEIYGKTARDLLLHIFAVELRYGQRLTGQAVSAYEDLPKNSLDAIFGIGTRAQALLTKFLDSVTDADLDSTITFPTLSAGEQSATKRKVVAHALLHGIRHWAQLATEMRKHGYKTDWGHDFLFSDVMK
jgi:uncharacterized damage-inducible protein DinB